MPKIVSIKEDVKEVDDIGWFYSGRKNLYFYLIELSDGTCWMTEEQNTPWVEYDRFINDRIMALGTNEEACLIRLAPGQTGPLNSGNCLTNMHRVK